MGRSVALIGPPGTGKTRMAGLTAVRKPVHAIDIDRKIRNLAILAPAIAKGELTYKEIGDTLAEDGLSQRMKSLFAGEKANRPPRGWTNISNYIEGLEKDPFASKARTILFDSYTTGALHMKLKAQFDTNKNKFVWDMWAAWAQMWAEVTTIMLDYANTCQQCQHIHQPAETYDHENMDKDIIFTIHERVSEKPGDNTKGVRISQIPNTKTGESMQQKEYLGTMDILIAGTVDGSFGINFGAYFTDVYHTYVDVDDKTGDPTWLCRVLPDGLRDLRCSNDVQGQAIWQPDFRQIWGVTPRKEVKNVGQTTVRPGASAAVASGR